MHSIGLRATRLGHVPANLRNDEGRDFIFIDGYCVHGRTGNHNTGFCVGAVAQKAVCGASTYIDCDFGVGIVVGYCAFIGSKYPADGFGDLEPLDSGIAASAEMNAYGFFGWSSHSRYTEPTASATKCNSKGKSKVNYPTLAKRWRRWGTCDLSRGCPFDRKRRS
jgi:hypothetical protein